MTRSRTTARKAGTEFESSIAGHLAATYDDRIERRVKSGAKDRGDIGGVRLANNARVVVECKNTTRVALSAWVKEAEVERVNDAAAVGVVVHKRVGTRDPDAQFVTMTVRDFRALLDAHRIDPEPDPGPDPDTPLPLDFDTP